MILRENICFIYFYLICLYLLPLITVLARLASVDHHHRVHRLLAPAPPPHPYVSLALLSEVAQPVPLPAAAALLGAGGQDGGAAHLAHGAQGVGLLGGGGLVTPGDGRVDHSVRSGHHAQLLTLTHEHWSPMHHHQHWSWKALLVLWACGVF